MKIYNYPSKTAESKVSAIVNRGLSFSKKDYQTVNRILDESNTCDHCLRCNAQQDDEIEERLLTKTH